MTPAYTAKLGLTIWKTSVRAQKIDGSILKCYDIALARFSLQDSLGIVRFFEKTFLLTDTSMKMILGMSFLALSNTNFESDTEKLIWRSYITAEAFPTTSWIEFIDEREFAKAPLKENSETFVVHVAILEATTIHPSRVAQIAALLCDKLSTKISAEYSDYIDILS